ncbi:MAG TPA: adenylyl-sulfate kinase, partial [Armatimonadota bacterium]
AYAFPPQAVTLCLEDDLDISRGDMLAHPANVPWVAQELEAMLVWMDTEPLKPHLPYLVKHTTSLVRGRFTELQYRIDPDTLHRQPADRLGLNEIGRISMHLYRPLLCDEYESNRQTGSFVVIDPRSNFTVAAGMIIDRAHRYGSVQPEGRSFSAALPRKAVDRAHLLGQRPCTLWLTGLSGSGKSTLANALEERLLAMGHACFVLDGDVVRQGLNKDLGFSPDDRKENIRRIAEVARLFNEAGMLAITAFISPYQQDRQMAREIVGEERFLEIFVDAPLQECERRDPKGLYRQARAGHIPDFTGISAPYEPPAEPELRLETAEQSVEESVERILLLLKQLKIVG